jgi:peptidoglycan/LPS O-acetylase OafA/YrhL
VEIKKRNTDLDALRALSVLLVVFAHSGFSLIPGGLGVTIFFVISGYIITKLILSEVERTGNFSIWKFYGRRFWKIAPPFVIIIIIPTLFTWKIQHISLERFLSQVFFLYNWVKLDTGSEGVLSGTGVVWSLSIEEQFYIVVALSTFFLCLRSFRNLSKYLLCIFASAWIFSTVMRVNFSYFGSYLDYHDDTGNLPRIYLGTDTRMSSICAGAVLAILARNSNLISYLRIKKKFLLPLAYIIILISFVLSLTIRTFHFRDTLRFTLQEISTCLLVTLGPILGWTSHYLKHLIQSRIIQLIGLASYCIYLSHLMVMLAVERHLSYSNGVSSEFIKIASSVLSILIGILLYLISDKPFEGMRLRFRQ